MVEGWDNDAAMDDVWGIGESGSELGGDWWPPGRVVAREVNDALASLAADRFVTLINEMI
jgi:hypothetical protein